MALDAEGGSMSEVARYRDRITEHLRAVSTEIVQLHGRCPHGTASVGEPGFEEWQRCKLELSAAEQLVRKLRETVDRACDLIDGEG